MPFDEALKPVNEDHIKIVAQELGLKIGRSDDFFSAKSIMTEIWAAIYHSKMVIADCTGRNPNVFYEIGIAHTVGRPTILITQTMDDVPFDLRHIRCISYQYTPRGMISFHDVLRKTIETELSIK